MFVVGVIITTLFNLYFAIGFTIYIVVSNLIFISTICAYCPHYGSRNSLCGYGLVSKRITQRKSPKGFNRAFKRNIAVLFPDWFLPVVVGGYMLWDSFDMVILVLLIVFILIAFVGVLYVSKSKSCDSCKLKKNCPWMSLCSR
jgi:hypothetical protein